LIVLYSQRLDEEDRPTGCVLCPKRIDIDIDYKVCASNIPKNYSTRAEIFAKIIALHKRSQNRF